MNRRIVSAVAAIALVALIAPSAGAQTGFGVRYGSISVEGEYVKMDATSAFGAHVALGFIPVLKFQVGAEVLSGTATYNYTPEIPNTDFDQDFKSIGIFADVRYPIKLLPLFPVKPVIGGGINVNLMSYLDREMFRTGGVSPDVEDFTQTGYHLMFGLLIKPPFLPFSLTTEYRLQTIKLEDDTVSNNGFVIGLTFGF